MSVRTAVVVVVAGVVLIAGGVAAGLLLADDDEPGAVKVAGPLVDPEEAADETTTTTEERPATTTTGPGGDPADRAAVADFYEELEAAINAGAAEPFVDRLHSAVIDLYGEEQCRQHLAGQDDPELDFEVVNVGPPGRWSWQRDGQTAVVDDALTVDLVVRISAGEERRQAHVALVDGEIRWFTDCGDPVSAAPAGEDPGPGA